MTRKIAGTCIAAMFGFALTASAQTPPSQPADPQQPPSMAQPAPADKSASMGKEKKMTGCLQSGTEAGSFELTNIKGKSDKATEGATSAAQSAAPAAARSVKLMAGPDIDLSTHVGHTVELSGTWSASAGGSMAEPSASPMAHGKGTFNVTKVKMVAATCSTGTN